jgi:hypothetical protein
MMIDGGELKPFPVTAVLPLEDIRRVHEQADSGRLVGKTILAVSEA